MGWGSAVLAAIALRERALAKVAALAAAIAAGLEERGVPRLESSLAAHAGMAAFAQATADWLGDGSVDLSERFDLAHHAIRRLDE